MHLLSVVGYPLHKACITLFILKMFYLLKKVYGKVVCVNVLNNTSCIVNCMILNGPKCLRFYSFCMMLMILYDSDGEKYNLRRPGPSLNTFNKQAHEGLSTEVHKSDS